MADFTNPKLRRSGGIGIGGVIFALVALVVLALGFSLLGGADTPASTPDAVPAPAESPIQTN